MKSDEPIRNRVLVRLTKDAFEDKAILEFGDGKVYQVSPVTTDDLFRLALPQVSPGHWFNCELRRRTGYTATRLAGWPIDNPSRWLTILF